MDNGLTEYVLWLKLPSTEETFYLFPPPPTSRKGLVIRREEKAGKMVWLREENGPGDWIVWYSQEELCWRLGETGLSCADTVLITLSQVMIWWLEIKIKFEKSIVRPLWMSEGLCVWNKNSQLNARSGCSVSYCSHTSNCHTDVGVSCSKYKS